MGKRIISIDAETNGLWGEAFAIGAVVYGADGTEEKVFVARCPIEGTTNDWVLENVLPAIYDIKKTHESYDDMLADFAKFYLENKEGADIIVHVGLPVEAKLFLDMHKEGLIGDWDAPFPLLDVSAALAVNDENPTSVDEYNAKHNIPLPSGSQHNPLYDCRSAASAWMHLNR